MKLKFTHRAKADLIEIYDYIVQENPRAASRVITTIHASLVNLQNNPALGRPGRIDGTRELVVARSPFIAAYRIHENDIQVLAIIHAARYWPNSL